MKLNGKIQIVGGTPGVDKLLTCIDSSGNAEWKTLTDISDGDVIISGNVSDNILYLTKESGVIIDIDLSTLSGDCGDCVGKYVESINIVDDTNSVCEETIITTQEIVDSIETVVEVDPLTISKTVSDFTLTRFINECPAGYDVVYSSTTTGYFTESTGIGYNDWCPDGYTHDEIGNHGLPVGSKCFKTVTNSSPSCPAGYTLVGNVGNQICEKITTVAVIDNMDLSDPNKPVPQSGFVFEEITTGNNLPTVYGSSGGIFMDINPSTSYPFEYNGGSVIEPNTIINNSLWQERLCSSVDSGTNNVGIWGDYPSINMDNNIWLGFNHCIEITESKTYVIGIASDNLSKLSVDGQKMIEFTNSGEGRNFKHWWLFPITLDAGQHIISMEGYDANQFASFGAEIYDVDIETLKTYTTEAELIPNIIFSTKEKQNSTPSSYFDISDNPTHLRYSCPSGFLLTKCSDNVECTKVENVTPVLSTTEVVDTNPELEVKCRKVTNTCPDCEGDIKLTREEKEKCEEDLSLLQKILNDKLKQLSELEECTTPEIFDGVYELENEDNSPVMEFDILSQQPNIAPFDYTTATFEWFEDSNLTSPITPTNNYVSAPTILYIKVTDTLGCDNVSTLDLRFKDNSTEIEETIERSNVESTPIMTWTRIETKESLTSTDTIERREETKEHSVETKDNTTSVEQLKSEISELETNINLKLIECGECFTDMSGSSSDVYEIGNPNYVNNDPLKCLQSKGVLVDEGCCKKLELTYNDGTTTHVNIDELYSDNNNYSLTLNDNILTFSMSSSCNTYFEDITVDLSSLGGSGSGSDGIGINNTIDNNDGTFTFEYTDGSKFTTSNLSGKDGENGKDGINGTNGENGKDGINGTNGENGKDGINGTNGQKGETGENGVNGTNGTNGENGKDGINGEKGEPGKNGINGINGEDGTNGENGKDGIDGNGISETSYNEETGELTLIFDDKSIFTTTDLRGDDGKDGINGTNGENGKDGANGKDGINGTKGDKGNGINNTINNGDGTYTFNYDDGTSFTTSDLTVDSLWSEKPTGNNIYRDIGNVGIGTDSPSERLHVSGNIIADSISSNGPNNIRILNPEGGEYSSNTKKGYIVITLPQGWTNTMLSMTVKIFDYSEHEHATLNLAGYTYAGSINSGAIAQWTATSAWVEGNPIDEHNFKVRFGYDNAKDKCVIVIGNVDTTWSIPKVYVTDLQAAANNYQSSKWNDGWDIIISETVDINANRNTDTGIWIDDTHHSTQAHNWIRNTDNSIKYQSGNVKILGSNSLTINDYTFPINDGEEGQILKTDGKGNLNWLSDETNTDKFLKESILVDGFNNSTRCVTKTLQLTMSDDSIITTDLSSLNSDNYVANLLFDDSTNILTLVHKNDVTGNCDDKPPQTVDLSSLNTSIWTERVESGKPDKYHAYYNLDNIGIGTDLPKSKLHIEGPNYDESSIRFLNGARDNLNYWMIGSRSFSEDSGGDGFEIGRNFGADTDNDLTGGKFYITKDGDISIGNGYQPSKKLEVSGDIFIDNTDSTLTINDYTLPSADGDEGQVLKTDGRGTTSWGSASGRRNVKKVSVGEMGSVYESTHEYVHPKRYWRPANGSTTYDCRQIEPGDIILIDTGRVGDAFLNFLSVEVNLPPIYSSQGCESVEFQSGDIVTIKNIGLGYGSIGVATMDTNIKIDGETTKGTDESKTSAQQQDRKYNRIKPKCSVTYMYNIDGSTKEWFIIDSHSDVDEFTKVYSYNNSNLPNLFIE